MPSARTTHHRQRAQTPPHQRCIARRISTYALIPMGTRYNPRCAPRRHGPCRCLHLFGSQHERGVRLPIPAAGDVVTGLPPVSWDRNGRGEDRRRLHPVLLLLRRVWVGVLATAGRHRLPELRGRARLVVLPQVGRVPRVRAATGPPTIDGEGQLTPPATAAGIPYGTLTSPGSMTRSGRITPH